MNRQLTGALALLSLLAPLPAADAFCGFYVAKADTKLFNKASQVVLVRHDDKTVLTMANDYEGDPKEFAIVIPVPTFLEKDQIHVGDKTLLDHLDAYSAPRLVEYYDDDPCHPRPLLGMARAGVPMSTDMEKDDIERAKALGVTVEAKYTIGEYDIVILSADQSDGLETWLKENQYRIPDGASQVLVGYIKQKMRFFVAKVNLEAESKLGFTFLRPIQIAYESPKFMLPIRLGMLNANGPQDLVIYALSEKGRVETTNYRVVKLPTGMDIPLYVKDSFGDFYKAMFNEEVKKEDMRVIFQEYAWDMGWCDPCAAEPLSNDELRKLGVYWLSNGEAAVPMGGMQDVFLTRLHLRYDAEHFPEDLVFQETGDRTNFQGRYVLRHPWVGTSDCPAAKQYRLDLADRQKKEADTLANLTGWNIEDIYNKMGLKADGSGTGGGTKWYERIWGEE